MLNESATVGPFFCRLRGRGGKTSVGSYGPARTKCHKTVRWAVFITSLPVCYVLSSGPAFWLQCAVGDSRFSAFIDVAYAPLFWLADYSWTFHDVWVQYVSWWIEFGAPPIAT